MLFFIGALGLHKRKVKAMYLFYFYTLVGSFFLLFSIIVITFEIGNSSILSITNYNLVFKKQIYL
jgi:NADH:ubiquinone oxidoreductase subunit 4 (subunit M)